MKGGWKNSRKHRSSLSVMAEILEIAMNGALKTPIRYKANLSFGQFNEYLSFLLEIGLLKDVNNGGKTVYKTSAKGFRYIQSYKKITALLIEKGNVRGKEPLKMPLSHSLRNRNPIHYVIPLQVGLNQSR